MLAALSWGIIRDALGLRSWRRTVRTEFRRALRQTVGGGLGTVLVAAILAGLGLVSQALYWFGLAGQEQLGGTVLVTVLVDQLTPLLIGVVLLGQSGTATLTELGSMQLRGQVHVMAAQGLDPILLLVLPRVLAFAVASFTLGVLFVLVTLLVGFVTASLLGTLQETLWKFLDEVLGAMRAVDVEMLPAKTLATGALVALTACLTALTANPGEDLARLLPRGFIRGVLAIMAVDVVIDLAA
jgi:phospholipid/cholesterol/gamma-HCH transport system permease protein